LSEQFVKSNRNILKETLSEQFVQSNRNIIKEKFEADANSITVTANFLDTYHHCSHANILAVFLYMLLFITVSKQL
jgi:hypothetical protein